MSMGDAFEDFASDQDFSDVDDGASDQSDGDVARVLDLLGEAPAPPPRDAVVQRGEALQCAVETDTPCPPPQAMTDFECFLQAFERNETKRSPKSVGIVNLGQSVTQTDADGTCGDNIAAHDRTRRLEASWGVFVPAKMPMRREPEGVAHQKKALRVVVPSVAFLRRLNRRIVPNNNNELTFQPRINKSYERRRGIGRLRVKLNRSFVARMQQDVQERQARRLERDRERKAHEEEEENWFGPRRPSLVAKGSQLILKRNGLLEESAEDKMERLLRRNTVHSAASNCSPVSSTKRRDLHENELAKARACESLYRRGVDKLQRQRHQSRDERKTVKVNRRSRGIVRDKLHRDIQLICSSSSKTSTGGNNNAGEECDGRLSLPSHLSFVEFSCVMLHFGFVPNANTLWNGSSNVTMLWHAWTMFGDDEEGERRVRIDVVKELLEAVIVKPHHTRPRILSEDSDKSRLLKLFRLNYLCRKQASPSPASPRERKTLRAQMPQKYTRATYSLHGKALRANDADKKSDILTRRHTLSQHRLNALRREKEEHELAECTFKPSICRSSGSDSALVGYTFREGGKSKSVHAFDRLYEDAFVRQSNSVSRYYRARMEEEEKMKKEAHISPTYVNGLTIEERLQRLHESLSNNAVPTHFHEKIAEMRMAYANKVEEAQVKASRLEPASQEHSKTKDGRTIVTPFHLATADRGEQKSRRRRSSATNSPTRGSTSRTSALLRELRLKYDSGDCVQDQTEQTRDDIASCDAELCINVHISPFETSPLTINRAEDVNETVDAFSTRHGLDNKQRARLLQHVEDQLKQLFNL